MKRISFQWLAAVVVAVVAVSPAWAQDTADAAGGALCEEACGGCGQTFGDLFDVCSDNPCGGGLVFQGEALFFRYHRADGVRVGNLNPGLGIDDVVFDHEASPRLTLGWVSNNGLGIRTRYWDYDQSSSGASSPPDRIDVDTYTIDIELFERICLNNCWSLEISGGLRYNEFEELILDQPGTEGFGIRLNAFDAWGGVAGLEVTRSLGRLGGLYARSRGAILMDNKFVGNLQPINQVAQVAILQDTTQGMTELALGYEFNRCLNSGALLTFRAGWEWQNWFNYSTSFSEVTQQGLNAGVMGGPSDVGFAGPTLMVGFEM